MTADANQRYNRHLEKTLAKRAAHGSKPRAGKPAAPERKAAESRANKRQTQGV